MYTLIGYKPSTSDCHGSYHYYSDFEYSSPKSFQELVKQWANLVFQNKTKEYGEASYQFLVYIDGKIVYNDRDHSGLTWDWDDEIDEDEQAVVWANIELALKKATELADIQIEKTKQEKLKKEAERAEKRAKERELEERQQLAKLQEKYGKDLK